MADWMWWIIGVCAGLAVLGVIVLILIGIAAYPDDYYED